MIVNGMRNIFIIIMLLLFGIPYTMCQETPLGHSSIKMEIERYSQKDTIFSLSIYKCRITQSIQIHKMQDSIQLFLDVNKFHDVFFEFFYNKLKVCGIHNNDTINLNYKIKNYSIIVNCHDTDSLVLSYYYNPDYLLYGNENICLYFIPYQNTWQSIFFTNPNLIIDKFIINYPENDTYAFINKDICKIDDFYLTKDALDDLSIFLLDSFYYTQHIINKNYRVLFYLLERCVTDSIVNDINDLQIKDINTTKRIPTNFFQTFSDMQIFFNKEIDVLSVIDANMDIFYDKDTLRWGSCFNIDTLNSFIIMDTSFWYNNNWCHELTHVFNKKLPSMNDTSYYFFHEAMTEYLSVCFSTKNRRNIKNVFIEKYNKYQEIKDNYPSIFQVCNNELGFKGHGTYGVCYLKTPYCIYLFAQSIGQRKFLRLYSKFYHSVGNEKYNFSDFEYFMLKHGVSLKKWNVFINNLYSKMPN